MAMDYRIHLRDPIVVPPLTTHTHTVVFLHGRGDTADSFSCAVTQLLTDSRGRTLPQHFPQVRWVFPRAPLRPMARHPGSRCNQWFDTENPPDFAGDDGLQTPGMKEVVPTIRHLLAEEAGMLGGQMDRIVLAGLSMGGALSAHVLFNLNIPSSNTGRDTPRLAGVMGFACRCPFASQARSSLRDVQGVLGLQNVPADNSVLANTPVMLQHCADDPTVRVRDGAELRDILRGLGAAVEWREYPDGGHAFKQGAGWDDTVRFLVDKAGLKSHVLDQEVEAGFCAG